MCAVNGKKRKKIKTIRIDVDKCNPAAWMGSEP